MKLRKKRRALRAVRRASKILGVRSGVFMHKLKCRDADAQAALVVAEEERGDFDPDQIAGLIEMILELFEMLAKIFKWDD
jgi:hypothetical protein